VDGGASHTHGPGLDLIEWKWYEGTELIGSFETAELLLPVRAKNPCDVDFLLS